MSSRSKPQVPAVSSRLLWASRLESVAFFLTLLIVAMRPLLNETFYSSLDAMSRAAQAVGDPTPATTAWLDFGIWVAAIAAALSSLLQKRPWRFTGAEIGGVVLAIAAVISTLAASNKRLALNASSDWLTALVLAAVVANLCRDRMRIGLLLAALAASGMTSVARSGMQVGVEYAETRQVYNESKHDFWAQQNVALDDPRVQLYERRLDAAEAGGFFPLSNTNAAWLSLAGFAFLGLRGLVWRKRWASYAMLPLAALPFAAILLTGSKGAMVATAAGIVIWFLLVRYHLELQDRWRFALLAGWAILAGLVSVAITYGVSAGGLPGDSLQFRWNYWEVTRDIVESEFATGVGALNFDHAYLAVKPIEFPEEIRDPHNFMISVLAQWGVLGGVGLLAVFVGGSIVMAKTWGTRVPTDAPPPVYDPEAKYLSMQWVVAVSIGMILLRIWLLSGWLNQTTGAAYIFFDLGLYGLIWILVFAGLCWIARGGWTGDVDICQVACLAGVLAFLLHNLIDQSMFFPGTLMPFAAMAGILVTDTPNPRERTRVASRPAIPFVIAAGGALVFAALVLVPVTRANALLQHARYSSTSPDERWDAFERAVHADPLDPAAPEELALEYAGAGGDVARALQWLNEAVQRDPKQIGLYRERAHLLEASFRQSDSMVDLIGAIGSARQVVLMYPQSPDDHLLLADMLARNAQAAGDGAINEAIVHYEEALMLDGARAQGEIRRWPEPRRRDIQERLDRLYEMTASQPADSQPAASEPARAQPATQPAQP